MIDKTILSKILEAGIRAPSGDNAQPWRFKIRDNNLYIYCIPDADESYYDYKLRGSFIAHGAMIENIVIAASTVGYNVDVQILPDKKQSSLTTKLKFIPTDKKSHNLYDAIFKRATNRKKYKSIKLSQTHKKELLKLAKQFPNFKLILVEDNRDKKNISEALSFTDRFMLEDRHTHKNVFGKIIRWTIQEADETGTGFYIKTLELAPVEEVAIKLFCNWELLTLLRKFGISKMLQKNMSRLYNTSSAIGIVVMNGKKDTDFILAGRFIQRLWLTATNLGIAFAPVTALPYLASMIKENIKDKISDEHVKDVLDADNTIRNICGIKNEAIVMTFRLGYADKPSAYSKRLPINKVMLH